MTQNNPHSLEPSRIILFDGICNLCNAVVRFIILRDQKQLFTFARLQSSYGHHLLRMHGLTERTIDSIVLIQDTAVFIKSDAVLAISRYMPFPYPLLGMFRFMPLKLRDYIYDFVARNRYRWFGKKVSCMVPTADIKSRFMD